MFVPPIYTGSKEEMAKAWVQYLLSTDARVAVKGTTLAEKIATSLVDRDYLEPEDLMGVVLADETFDGLVRFLFHTKSHLVPSIVYDTCARTQLKWA